MRLHHLLLFSYSATLPIAPTLAFASHRQRRAKHSNNTQRDILSIRGGDITIMSSTATSALSSAIGPITETLRQALVSGSPLRSIGALYAISSLTVVPLTWYRTAYSFSVGYGLSVSAMALALLASFTFAEGGTALAMSKLISSGAPTLLATTALIYGVRLAVFIFVRECTVEEKRKVFDSMNSTPVLKRTPLALGVSLLYTFMMSPVLFAFRTTLEAGSTLDRLQVFFTNVAAFGMILESVADQHKFEVKRQNRKDAEAGKFVGPTTWSYKICRHPNYLGEILHWAGLFAAGCTSFGTSITAWVSGVLGLWGIMGIMLGSSANLDKKQLEKYGGQATFDEWKGGVTSSVIPFIR